MTGSERVDTGADNEVVSSPVFVDLMYEIKVEDDPNEESPFDKGRSTFPFIRELWLVPVWEAVETGTDGTIFTEFTVW